MLLTIMVPLDGSSLAEHALPSAVALARRSGATVHLVRVHDALAANVDARHFPDVDDAIRDEERSYIQHVAGRLGAAGVAGHGVVVDGAPVTALGEYAAGRRVDLIVMTTHGRTGVSRAWVGSVADGVMRGSGVPVLMIRPGGGTVDVRRDRVFTGILVPLDGSARAEAVLDPAVRVAETCGASVTLLHVVEPAALVPQPLGFTWTQMAIDRGQVEQTADLAEEHLRAVAERLRLQHAGLVVRTEVHAFEHTAAGILERAHSPDFDLVAMTTQGRGASRLLLGSIADKVLRGTAQPLLLLRAGAPSHENPELAPEVAAHYGGVAGRRI